MSVKHTVRVLPRAYTLENNPLPFSRATFLRWEKKGIIPKLLRLGGKTLLQSETVEALLNGAITPPSNPGRHKPPVPRVRPRGGHPSKLPKPDYRPEFKRKPAADAAE
jgi:hypothetical protein